MKDVVTAADRTPTLLVTGFGAFPGAPVNPTLEILAALEQDGVPGVVLALEILPVVFDAVGPALAAAVARHRPDAILLLGLATRRRTISVETRARNRVGLLHPDAAGARPQAATIAWDAPAELTATWPAAEIHAALTEAGLPAQLSDDAGDYVCNATLYRALLTKAAPCIGFLHVPPPDASGLAIGDLTRAARLALAAMAPAACSRMTRRFVLQALDPATGSPAVEARLRIGDIAALRAVLRLEDDDDPNVWGAYEVGYADLERLGSLSDPPFAPDPIFTILAPWHSIRDVPYLVHTGFELPLMLEGRKPLAVFHDVYPNDEYDRLLVRFDAAVRENRLIRRIVERPFTKPNRDGYVLGMREAYFALPGEEWRIDSHIQLRMDTKREGWTEDTERREGTLLGYESWQNDWWISQMLDRKLLE